MKAFTAAALAYIAVAHPHHGKHGRHHEKREWFKDHKREDHPHPILDRLVDGLHDAYDIVHDKAEKYHSLFDELRDRAEEIEVVYD